MAWQTPKTNWGQAGQTVPGVDDFNRIEGNIETLGKYDRAPGYGTATGTNAKAITLNPAPGSYYDGLCFAFKNATQNTGAVTINVNGLGAKAIKKPNGNNLVSGNLKTGSVYTVRYNGTNFILQGSDSTGNATPEHVLAGKTFSNDTDTELTGTMPNQGAKIIIPSTVNQAIPAGYHNGQGYVVGSPNLVASNIRNGVNIFGVVGNVSPAIDFSQAPIIDTTIDADVSNSNFTGSEETYAYSTTTPCKAVVFTGNIRAYTASQVTSGVTNVIGYVEFRCKASGATFYIAYARTYYVHSTSECNGYSFMLINSGESYLRLTPWDGAEFGALSFYDLSGGFDIYCYIYANEYSPNANAEAKINGRLRVW